MSGATERVRHAHCRSEPQLDQPKEVINDIYDDGQRPRHHRLSQMDQRQGGREDGVCGGGEGRGRGEVT